MAKPRSKFVGKKTVVVDLEWIREQQQIRDLKERKRVAEWSKKWINITRLKTDRLWTESAIKKWLGEPRMKKKCKLFIVEDVRKAEQQKAFQEWLAPRVEKKLVSAPHFKIKKIGTV